MTAADLQRIQSYLRFTAPRGRDHTKIGPFLATFNRDTATLKFRSGPAAGQEFLPRTAFGSRRHSVDRTRRAAVSLF